jgi:hypothetical protein
MSVDDGTEEETEEESEFKKIIDNWVSDHGLLHNLSGTIGIDTATSSTMAINGNVIDTVGHLGTHFNNLVFDQHEYQLPVSQKDLELVREHLILLMKDIEDLKKALKLKE